MRNLSGVGLFTLVRISASVGFLNLKFVKESRKILWDRWLESGFMTLLLKERLSWDNEICKWMGLREKNLLV